MHPILILVLSIAVVVLLIIRFRLHAFLSLIIAAMTVGLLSDKVPLTDVMSEATRVFGEVCGSIGVVIALAAVIGHCLMESGAADRITRRLVAVLGEKRSSLSMLTSGYVLSVPVFFDTVFYLLIPLARALRVRTGKNYLLYTMAICAGGAVTHTLVPPTPGPLAIATTLNIDLGIVILVGVVIGIPMSVVGWMFSRFMDRRLDIDLRTPPGLQREELEALAHRDESELPPLWLSILPIVLPIVLIASNTVAKTMGASASVTEVMSFVGNPNFALLLSAVVAMVMLARSMSYSVAKLGKVLEPVLASAGLIILITAAGGAYGGMLRAAGVGSTLAEMAQEWGVPLLVMGFLMASVLKIAQGSGTVAMITVSAMVAPILVESPPPFHPVYFGVAIASGSLVGSWMNDSGFWIYKQMSGLTEAEALKTWTPLLAILGVTGFGCALLGSVLFPMT